MVWVIKEMAKASQHDLVRFIQQVEKAQQGLRKWLSSQGACCTDVRP